MIRVSVHLLPWHGAEPRELARMDIWNDGEQTVENDRMGTYHAHTLRGRTTEALNAGVPQKRASIGNWPRHDLHIWNLVRLLLETMGYTQTRASVDPARKPEAIPVVRGWVRGAEFRQPHQPPPAPERWEWEPVFTFTAGE